MTLGVTNQGRMPGNPSPLPFKYDMASGEEYEVVLNGGAPWGFRLQGGKEFRAPLRIAKVSFHAQCPKFDCQRAGMKKSSADRGYCETNVRRYHENLSSLI